ncbi:MAG: molybdopterin molybdotransferase MoeA [Dehalococcoidia bacterium]|nr:molybdopterin molybdotransferase MoeA [Dehalococcoidia bacterium]
MAKYKTKNEAYLNADKFASREETVARLLQRWHHVPCFETVALEQALGRFVAEDLSSHNTLPVCRSSQRDGIAVRYADFMNGLPDVTNWREDIDYATADMGDDFDDDFDTVIQIEDAVIDIQGKLIGINPKKELQQGQLINHIGATLKENEPLLLKGQSVNPCQLNLLAAAGIGQLKVTSRPKIYYIPTGSELIPRGQIPMRGQNIESNGIMIQSVLTGWQADLFELPIIKDAPAELEKALDQALDKADIVLINGGSSMGCEDFVSELLSRKASWYQHGVRSIPGIPVAVSIISGKPVINLPGPPFAAFCAIDWCVKALIAHWYGCAVPLRRRVRAKLSKSINKSPQFEFYVRLKLDPDENGGYIAKPLTGDNRFAVALGSANALIVLPFGNSGYAESESIEAELLFTEQMRC